MISKQQYFMKKHQKTDNRTVQKQVTNLILQKGWKKCFTDKSKTAAKQLFRQ
jgi:hypothetical protein